MTARRNPKPCPCGAVILTKSGPKGRGYRSFVHYIRSGLAEVHAVEGCRLVEHVVPRKPDAALRYGEAQSRFDIRRIAA